jgi:predicted nucleic acid-binding protein
VSTLLLVDTSAWVRIRQPSVADRLSPLLEDGLIATCAMLDMEALRTVNSRPAVAQMNASRAGLRWLSTPDDVWDRALDIQAELSSTGRRTHIPVQDLLIAGVAERHRATVLHYDHDFDTIAEITGQQTEWVVPAGSIP